MGLKEKAVALTLLMIALYAAAAATWFMHSELAWKKAASKYKSACATYSKEVETIEKERQYKEEYEQAKALMPSFEAEKTTDGTWRRAVREIAQRNLILISDDEAKAEIVGDDVHELPIEVRSWEGSLEALVKFIYELENSEDGMFAVTELNFKPSQKKGYLRGSFKLHCAYMRDK